MGYMITRSTTDKSATHLVEGCDALVVGDLVQAVDEVQSIAQQRSDAFVGAHGAACGVRADGERAHVERRSGGPLERINPMEKRRREAGFRGKRESVFE